MPLWSCIAALFSTLNNELVYEGELMRGLNILTADIGNCTKGMYFIRLSSAGYNKTEKLIIQ